MDDFLLKRFEHPHKFGNSEFMQSQIHYDSMGYAEKEIKKLTQEREN